MTKYNKLQDKHVLVIGGSAGIGNAVAAGSLEAGARVTISSSSRSRLDAAVSALASSTGAEAGSRITGLACDLSNADTLEADLERLFQTAGPVDHVVYTAADALSLAPLDGMTPALAIRAAHMRMVAPLMVAKVAARHLPKTRSASLTLTTGTIAEKPEKGWAVVAYFGGGIQSMTKALALELAPVRVNAVRPGVADTGLWDPLGEEGKRCLVEGLEAKLPTGKVGQVEDIAEAYLWLMKDGNATGSVAGTDGGTLLV